MRRTVAVVAVVALLLGTLAGFAAVVWQAWETRSSAPERLEVGDASVEDVTTAPEPTLDRFYGQEVAWDGCGAGYECGWLTVPLDYDDPAGETIQLRLLRLPAGTDERIGALVVNPGGPGAPGTEYAAMARAVFRQPLLDHFDVVGFDPRGTGASAPLDCLADDELDAYLETPPVPRTPDEVAALTSANQRFFQGCRERSGDVVDHVSTVEVARDMDVLRAALGEGQLDYFGASYGTQIGATYAELFPERVGHLVLDGALDVAADNVEKSLVQAGGFETALRAYAADCLERPSCPLEGSVDDALATVSDLVERAAKDPLPTGSDRELTAGLAFYGIVMPLYNRDYWNMLTIALDQALKGNGAGLLSNADAYTGRTGEGYRDNSIEAITVINCLDDPGFVPVEEVPDRFAEFDEVAPTFGRVFAWGLMGCAGFDGEAAEPLEIDGAGAAPILVTGTTRDPATPMVWAEALAEQLESAVLVRRDGDGHTAYNNGNDCVDEAVEAYLLDGKVPEDGLSC